MGPLKDYRRRIEETMIYKRPFKYQDQLRPWPFIDGRVTDHSYDLAFEVPYGYSYEDLESQVDALCAACGAIVEVKNRAGVVVLSVYPQDLPSLIPYETDMINATRGRRVLLGYDREQKQITHSFDIPHMLIAGQSGYGKTDAVRFILYQLITRYTPDQLEIQIIDMKGFSFLPFRGIPHITRIEYELDKAVEILDDAYDTMQERARAVIESGDRSLVDSFKWRIVLIDEASQLAPDLVTKDDKPLANRAAQRASAISCIGREASVGLLFATQYPTKEVVHGQIRANMEAVLCFKTENDVHSRVALGSSGAEKISTEGRAFYKSRKGRQLIQVPFVGTDPEWQNLLAPYKVVGGNDKKRTNEAAYPKTPNLSPSNINRSSRQVLP